MAKEKEILTAFAQEMRRHNSVKRRIAMISEIIVLGCILLFVILMIGAVISVAVEMFPY